jgi:hypothetical protein
MRLKWWKRAARLEQYIPIQEYVKFFPARRAVIPTESARLSPDDEGPAVRFHVFGFVSLLAPPRA